MATITPTRICPTCGHDKQPWFNHCDKCYAQRQTQNLKPNICNEQDCEVEIRDDYFLCNPHFQDLRDGRVSECASCGEHKPNQFDLCRRCSVDTQPMPQTPTPKRAEPESNRHRPYDHHNGADDQKAKDKRYWFNRQDNGVCNYCGHRYPYDQMEMEHIIPKELGGPDHRRNMQLTCHSCNRKKGTATDIEFRETNQHLIPTEERTPPNRPINTDSLRSKHQGPRYRQPAS